MYHTGIFLSSLQIIYKVAAQRVSLGPYMSFFKRLMPLKANMSIDLASSVVEQGQPFKGVAALDAKESFMVEEVRMEITVKESYQEPVWERDSNGNQHQVIKNVENIRYSQKVPVSQSFEMVNGSRKEFPFEVTIPMYTPSKPGGNITYSLKAVANVKGRPDVTRSVNPMITPSTVATRIIEREVIKVPCKYCGALVELTADANKCPSCGAPLKLG
jgi:hypothetical protein